MARITRNSSDNIYMERTLLRTAFPFMRHDWFGKSLNMPLNSSMNYGTRKYYHFNEDKTTGRTFVSDYTQYKLGETNADAGGYHNSLQYDDLTATVLEVGGDCGYTKNSRLFIVEDPVTEALGALGKQAGLVADAFYRQSIIESTDYDEEAYGSTHPHGRYVDCTTATQTTDALMAAAGLVVAHAFSKDAVSLMDTEMQPITKLIKNSEKVGSVPVAESFYVLTDAWMYDFLSEYCSKFKPVRDYGDGGVSAVQGEFGMLPHFRFIATSHAHRAAANTAAGANIYSRTGVYHHMTIFTEKTYGMISLRGKGKVEIIHHKPGESGIADRYDREGSLAWLSWLGFIDLAPLGRRRIAVKLDN